MRRALITGGAGCIGSELAKQLLQRGWAVRVIDNLSSGRREHLAGLDVEFIEGDMDDVRAVRAAVDAVDMVWHLTAKTDIKFLERYDFAADFFENVVNTWNLLNAMRNCKVRRLAFASSAAVYGEAPVLYEDLPPRPISMYGATKLSCEEIIKALCLRDGFTAQIFRFCSIVSGKARTSGNMVMPDFVHRLRQNPKWLLIMGDGNQTKPSLHVSECVDAMLYVVDHAHDPYTVMNIGVNGAVSVTRTAELVCEAMQLKNVQFEYTGGSGGWPGDVPSFSMDVAKLAEWGWKAKMTPEQALRRAIKELLESGE